MKLLIFGSNFGLIHLEAAIKSKKFKKIAICSPNIGKKKIPKNIIKYEKIDDAISNFNYDMVTIATLPLIQHKILLKIRKKSHKEIEVISGPYKSINLLKNDYIELKNFGFEELEIIINE